MTKYYPPQAATQAMMEITDVSPLNTTASAQKTRNFVAGVAGFCKERNLQRQNRQLAKELTRGKRGPRASQKGVESSQRGWESSQIGGKSSQKGLRSSQLKDPFLDFSTI